MTTARGHLASITVALGRLARAGDAEGLRDFVAGSAFLLAFQGIDPGRRRSVLRAFAKAEALCEARARHPLTKPKRINARRSEKVNWSDPVMRAKLAAAYARVGGDDEKASRFLGVTVGSARLAKKRHLNPAPRDLA